MISQLLGAGSFNSAKRASAVALRASSILGLAIAGFVALAGPWLVGLINTPEEIAGDATMYLWIVAGGMAFNAYIVAASAVLRAHGRTVALLVLGLFVNILDVVMMYVFIFILDLGVVGAALPTLLIRGGGVLLLAWLVRKVAGVRPFAPLPEKDAPVDAGAARMAKLSIPSVLENGTYNLVIIAVVSLINILGTDMINGRSYTLTLTALVTGVVLALAQGNETIVGWDVGERTLAHAKWMTLRTAIWTAAAAAALTALLWYFAEPALSIFWASEAVIAAATPALAISILLLPLSAVTQVMYGALRSSDDVIVPMAYSIASSVLVLLPLSWLFVHQLEMGLVGVFWALVAAEAVKPGLLTWRWLSGAWLRTAPVVAEDVA